MSQPYIDQLFKGKVKQLGDPNAEKRINRQWETGMFKKPTEEKIWLSETGLIGDEVADKKNHGGPKKRSLLIRQSITTIGKEKSSIQQWKLAAWVKI